MEDEVSPMQWPKCEASMVVTDSAIRSNRFSTSFQCIPLLSFSPASTNLSRWSLPRWSSSTSKTVDDTDDDDDDGPLIVSQPKEEVDEREDDNESTVVKTVEWPIPLLSTMNSTAMHSMHGRFFSPYLLIYANTQ